MHGEKIEYAKQVAGALSFVALGQSDRRHRRTQRSDVPLHPARRGRKATKPLFDTLVSMNANGQTDIPRAFDAVPRQRGASIRLFFTDFLFEDGIEPSLRKLRSRGGELRVSPVFSIELHPSLRETCYWWTRDRGGDGVFCKPSTASTGHGSVIRWADDIEAKCRGLDTLDSSPLFPWKSW